jgi:hypothetical protein
MLKLILLVSLFLLLSSNFAHASALESSMIEVVKFLEHIPALEGYREDGNTLFIVWKGMPNFSPHTN